MRFQLITIFIVLACVSNAAGQIDFDSPAVLQTNFTRQVEGKTEIPPTTTSSCNCESHGGVWSEGCHGSIDYSNRDLGSAFSNVEGCDYGCRTPSRWGLTVSGIIDIPLDGVFHTGDDTRTTAGTLGVPTAIYTAGTPIDLLINEQGFEDIYDTFGGVQANMTFALDCNTDFFLGYRFVRGQADQVTVGQAIANPATAPVAFDLNAQFSDFTESQIQMGFLTSRCLRNRLDFVWGGRMGLGFVDDVTATFDIPGVVTLSNVPFYDETTTFTFGFNYGLEMDIGCHLTAQILSGIEYRTSLDEIDTALVPLGLEELNDGSGFASLPVYLGMTYRR